MKVIFLDVDGVLHDPSKVKTEADEFDPSSLFALKKIVDATDAKVVLSSTWKYHILMAKRVADKLWEFGIDIDSATPGCDRRENEIKQWIFDYDATHVDNVERYVVLDDDDMSKTFHFHMIHTVSPGKWQLNLDDAEKAIRVLNS